MDAHQRARPARLEQVAPRAQFQELRRAPTRAPRRGRGGAHHRSQVATFCHAKLRETAGLERERGFILSLFSGLHPHGASAVAARDAGGLQARRAARWPRRQRLDEWRRKCLLETRQLGEQNGGPQRFRIGVVPDAREASICLLDVYAERELRVCE